jgi:NitT/TauT family transport system substrate-binding protein
MQDENVKIIAPFNNENPFLVIAKADAPMSTIQDLRGRKLGFSRPGSASQGILNLLLERTGVSGVQMVATGQLGDTWTAIRGNVVDAGWSQDPLAAGLILKGEAKIIARAADVVPDYMSDTIVARQDYLRQNPTAARAFIQTTDRAGKYVAENWKELVPTLAGFYGDPEDVMRATLEPMDHARVWSLKVYPEAFKQVEATMRDSGQLTEPVPWDRIFDQQYLAEPDRARL